MHKLKYTLAVLALVVAFAGCKKPAAPAPAAAPAKGMTAEEKTLLEPVYRAGKVVRASGLTGVTAKEITDLKVEADIALDKLKGGGLDAVFCAAEYSHAALYADLAVRAWHRNPQSMARAQELWNKMEKHAGLGEALYLGTMTSDQVMLAEQERGETQPTTKTGG